MSFREMLSHPASQNGIRQRVSHALEQSLQQRDRVDAKLIAAAVDHGMEEALDDVVSKVAAWNVCAETFHDAFMMVVQKAEKFANQYMSRESEEHAFQNMRPDLPSDVNETQAENIMQNRHPKNLKDMQMQAMHKDPVGTEDEDDLDYEKLRKWAGKRASE